MTYEQQFIEDKISESLREAISAMEKILVKTPELTGYIYVGIFDEAIKYTTLPKSSFKSTVEPAFYIAHKGSCKIYLTNWNERKFLNYLFRSIKFTDYKYDDDYYSNFFPAQAEFSVVKLTIWALEKLKSPNQVKKGITGVTHTFNAILNKSAIEYYNVITKSKDEVLNDSENLFEKTPLKEIIYFRIGVTNHYLVFSETEYLYITNNSRGGPTGIKVESGKISENAKLTILGDTYEANSKGMETLEMSLFGECIFKRTDVRQEIDKRLKKMKPKK